VIAELKRLSDPITADIDPVKFAQNIQAESDRGAIMLAATMVDDALKERLASNFHAASRDDREKLFDYAGPAGTFSSRILLAKALGIIAPETRDTIDLIRHMRNACAHAQNALDFDSPAIRDAYALFVADSNPPASTHSRLQCRDLFVMVCGVISSTVRGGDLSETSFMLVQSFFEEMARGALATWVPDATKRPDET